MYLRYCWMLYLNRLDFQVKLKVAVTFVRMTKS